MVHRGLMEADKEDAFTLFVASTNIRYCYYKDTHKVLGNTYGMCVLQVRPWSHDQVTAPKKNASYSPFVVLVVGGV